MASLTPQSFDLHSDRPTLTIDANWSKHRRKDVLPLHPELVAVLPDWTKSLGPDDPLFPRLDRRKTWKMIKHDLKIAGIPYRTKEGYADFHASGRHSHITGLLRNGASLVEAKELARHADIRMTMRYTHIGIEDQAKALKTLPVPLTSWQRTGSESGNPACPETSPTGTSSNSGVQTSADLNTEETECNGIERHSLTPSVPDTRQAGNQVATLRGRILSIPAGLIGGLAPKPGPAKRWMSKCQEGVNIP